MVSSQQQIANIREPKEHDVLLDGLKEANRLRHHGSLMWRALVEANKPRYVDQPSYHRAATVRSIVLAIRQLEPPGRFLRSDPYTGLWYEAGDAEANKVTLAALRGYDEPGGRPNGDDLDCGSVASIEPPSGPSRRGLRKAKHVRDLRALAKSPSEASMDATDPEDSLVEIFARAMSSRFAAALEAEQHNISLASSSSGMSSDDGDGADTAPTDLRASESCAMAAAELDDIDESLSHFFRSKMSLATFDTDGSGAAGTMSCESTGLGRMARRFQRGPSNTSLVLGSNLSLMSNMSLISVFSNE
jgi:hypothetical protein